MGSWPFILPLAAFVVNDPTPPQQRSGYQALAEGRYLEARNLFAHAAFSPDGSVRDAQAFERWMQYSPMVTGELPIDTPARDPDRVRPDLRWLAGVRRANARPALPEIVSRARATSIVILNEAHYSPRDRAFALEVARALYPLGYSILAVEALFDDPGSSAPSPAKRLAADGVVRIGTGSYTRDPVFAGFLRNAVALGYRPLGYEMTPEQMSAGSSIAMREAAQTANLMTAIFAKSPRAKVLIYVGHNHVAEAPRVEDGQPTERMASRLKRATGIDPLTIDQTTLTDLSSAAFEAYPAAAARIGHRHAILFDGNRPLIVGPFAGAVDLQVVHPARRYRDGRPTWLAALGGRAVAIPRALLPTTGERLIQAFAADAPADAVPLDQVLVTAGKPVPKLMLPPGVRVRFATQD